MSALWVTLLVSVSWSQSTFNFRFPITCVLITVQITFATKTLPVISMMTVHLLTNQFLTDNLRKNATTNKYWFTFVFLLHF